MGIVPANPNLIVQFNTENAVEHHMEKETQHQQRC